MRLIVELVTTARQRRGRPPYCSAVVEERVGGSVHGDGLGEGLDGRRGAELGRDGRRQRARRAGVAAVLASVLHLLLDAEQDAADVAVLGRQADRLREVLERVRVPPARKKKCCENTSAGVGKF